MKHILLTALISIFFLLHDLPQAFAQYYASTGSDRYHKPSCRFVKKIAPANRLIIKDKKSAWDKGYKPCETCRPEGYDKMPAKNKNKR